MFTNAALVLFVAPSTGDNCHGSQRAGGQVSGTPGQATGRVICPVLASAGGRCVSGTLGSTKKFLFLEDTIMGLSEDNSPGGQSGQDSITCLVHRLGVPRPAEQAALEPGPALSTHQSGCWGRVPWPGRAGLCKPPDPAAHWSRWGLPIPPLLANNCSRSHPVGWDRPRYDYAYETGPQERKIRRAVWTL